MSFFSRLFGARPDPKEALRPLWRAIVAEARNPEWYRRCGAPDTLEGRFDMVVNIAALVMLRLERNERLLPASARLTELFVEDMDGQMREEGIGDPTLGKKMGRLMEAMGGRVAAYRDALVLGSRDTAEAVARNVRLRDGADAAPMAARLAQLHAAHCARSDEAILAGEIAL